VQAALAQTFFDRDAVRQMATAHEFARGEEYLIRGRVHNLRGQAGERYSAIVNRSTYYAVVVWREADRTRSSCSCSFGWHRRGVCRHTVAVMLAVLEDLGRGRSSKLMGDAHRTPAPEGPRPASAASPPKLGPTANGLTARDVMSAPAEALPDTASLADAWGFVQEHQVRHLPVVSQNGQVCGILSERDLMREAVSHAVGETMPPSLSERPVRALMVNRVLTAGPDTPVPELARLMFRERVGSLPIVDAGGGLLGIVTRSDILRAVVDRELR
jgi:acetoin utilization protein AcuB